MQLVTDTAKFFLEIIGILVPVLSGLWAILNGQAMQRRANEAVDTMSKTQESLRKDYSLVREERDRDRVEYQRNLKELDKRAKEAQDQTVAAQKAAFDLKAQYDALELRYKEIMGRNQVLSNDLEARNNAVEQLQRQYDALNNRSLTQAKNYDDLLKYKRDINEKYEAIIVGRRTIENQYKGLLASHTELTTAHRELSDKYEALLKSNTDMNTRLDEQLIQHERDLTRINEATFTQIESIRSALEQVKGQYDSLQDEHNKAQELIMQFTGMVQNARKFLHDLGLTDLQIEGVLNGKVSFDDIRLPLVTTLTRKDTIALAVPEFPEDEMPGIKPDTETKALIVIPKGVSTDGHL